MAAHSSNTHDRSEEALLEGGTLAGHGSNTRAFEETVLESRFDSFSIESLLANTDDEC